MEPELRDRVNAVVQAGDELVRHLANRVPSIEAGTRWQLARNELVAGMLSGDGAMLGFVRSFSDSEEATISAMERDGGSFVRSLAALLRAADGANFARASWAFTEYWDRYEEIGRDRAPVDLDAWQEAPMLPVEGGVKAEKLGPDGTARGIMAQAADV